MGSTKNMFIACLLLAVIFDFSMSTALPTTTFRLKNKEADANSLSLCLELSGVLCGGVATAALKTCATSAGSLRQEFIIDATRASNAAKSIGLKRKSSISLFRKTATTADDLSSKEYDVADAVNLHVTFTEIASTNVWKISVTDATPTTRYLVVDTANAHVAADNVVKWSSTDPASDTKGQWVFDTTNVTA